MASSGRWSPIRLFDINCSVKGDKSFSTHPHIKRFQCGDSCQPMSTPCGGSCPIGHILMGNECALQESLCPEAQCVQDSDCQDNAGCLLSGTVRGNKSWTQQLNCLQVMACQCYLNFVATQAAVDSCPRTGVCTHALEYAQVSRIKKRLIFWHFSLKGEGRHSSSVQSPLKVWLCFFPQAGSLPPCYEQGNTKICPFSFAKIGDTVFDYVSSSGGNGFGPNTYNGYKLFYNQY